MTRKHTKSISTENYRDQKILSSIEWPKLPKAIGLTFAAMGSAMLIGIILTAYEHGITEIINLFL